jgi:polygalacturonase
MKDGHGGIVIGSEISGGFKNLYVENCEMDSPNLDRVLRIKTNTCRGGVIEDIFLRNIKVGQCGEAVIKINLDYEHNEVCHRGFIPTVRNVYVDSVTCKKSDYGVYIIGLKESTQVYNINITNCNFSGVKNQKVSITGARDVKFKNLLINGKEVK